mgnify:CR=1 FL=1
MPDSCRSIEEGAAALALYADARCPQRTAGTTRRTDMTSSGCQDIGAASRRPGSPALTPARLNLSPFDKSRHLKPRIPAGS